MPNPFRLFLVLILLVMGGPKLNQVPCSTLKEAEDTDVFNRIKEKDIFQPKVITNFTEIIAEQNHEPEINNNNQFEQLS